jgi:mersacidin/lichenicidin family type 2 lantibiotic
MATVDIIRAWKDEEYRLSLSATQQALLPQQPAGTIELSNQ